MTIKTAILAAAIGALGLTTPASAEMAQPTTSSHRVSYADLDLLTPEGQAELQRRVNRAAWLICQQDPSEARRAPRAESQCYRDARRQGQLLVAEVIANRPFLGG